MLEKFKQMEKHSIAVYGSLRMNEYNYEAFARRYDMKHTGTHTISGFDLYSLGAYPAAVLGDGEIVVDTFEVDNDCFNSMNRMELGAGYYALDTEIDGKDHTIWLQRSGYEERRVESGDWTKHLREKRKNYTY